MQLIPQSTATANYRRIYFTTVDSTNLQTRVTGALAGGAYRISKNGAADNGCTNTPTEFDAADMPGVRYIELTASEVDSLGIVIVKISATGVEPRELTAMVVSATAFNPYATEQDVNVEKWDTAAVFKDAGGVPSVNVYAWAADPVIVPAVSGTPKVDLRGWNGTAPANLDNGMVPARENYPALGHQIFKVSETDANRRKFYFFLADLTGNPLTAVTWNSGAVAATYWLYLQKNNGAVATEATGTVLEVDSAMFPGLYVYTATAAELSTVGRLLIQPYINGTPVV